MGITISHKISIAGRETVKKVLDGTERVAGYYKQEAERLGISFEVERIDDVSLRIDCGNCETLAFYFSTAKEINKRADNGYDYSFAVLADGGKEIEAGYEIEKYPQNEMFYSANYCKTQFCSNLWEHKAIAEIIRSVASRARMAEVSDEADYYYTGDLYEAGKAIHSNGELINSIAGTLEGLGYDKIIKGGIKK